MKSFSTFYALSLALAVAVNAQTAPNFPVQVTTNLRADFQDTSTAIDPPGVLLSQDAVANIPTVQGPKDSSRTLTFLLFIIDQDFSSGGTRVPFLQFFQPNLAGGSEVLFADPTALNFTSTPSASYIPPSPPQGDGPHRYNLLLYSQPQGFQVPSAYSSFFPPASNAARLGFDMAGFAKAAGLGNPTLGTWFQVQNGQAVISSSSPASTTTTTTKLTTSSTTTSSTTTESTSSEVSTSTTSSESTSETTSTQDTTFSTAISTDSNGPSAESPTTSTVEATTTTAEPSIVPAASSASASTSTVTPSAAGMVEIRHSMKALAIGLILGVVGVEILV